MNACDICKHSDIDLYPIDGHFVCETCLMQGRLDEMPGFATIESHELELAGATLCSWWNRDVPTRRPSRSHAGV